MDPFGKIPQQRMQTPFLVLGFLFVVAVGASIIPASWFGIHQTMRRYAPLNLGTLVTPENLANDTDHNGSISWKELVASSLTINPDDATSSFETDPKAIAILNDPNNLTGSFSKNLYIAATALNQSGIADEERKQQVINQLIAKETSKVTAQIYTSADITTFPDTKTSIKNYGNNVASILDGLITEKTIVQDLTSINNYLQTADASKLIPLQENAARADGVIKKLLTLKVPASAAAKDIVILNKLSEYEDTLVGLSVADTDALRATVALKKYHNTVVNALHSYTLLSTYFDAKNIIFSSSEPGYIFIVGYNGVAH